MSSSAKSKWITLYVLELEHGCFYVGQSGAPDGRIDAHARGKGSAWTRVHKPLRLVERRPAETQDWKHAEEIENQLTLMMMRRFGWQRVRGGFWTNVSEELTRKALIHHERMAELAVSKPLEPYVAAVEEVGARPAALKSGDSSRPSRASHSWTEAEELKLRDAYVKGINVDEIASNHGRTRIAISARLVRIGLISHRSEA